MVDTEAERQEAERAAAAKLEAERQAAVRLAAEKAEAQRQEAARQEAARVEAARLEAERQAAARLAAQKAEAERLETARQEAARAEAARLEAERQAAARQAAEIAEAQRQEAARAEAARAEEAARAQAEREEDERREARRRAMGRILDEEAARREAATNSDLPYSQSMSRRIRLWGRTDPNAALIKYAEDWERKIQFNTPVNVVSNIASRPHVNPMVTVAIRSDGSLESITFVTSSGVPEVDEAIRRIVYSLVPYRAFPPALARDYDVVEIRRTWSFDVAVRLY